MIIDPAPLTQETVERLRFASLAMAQPPSGQRRWVQLGLMRKACDILDSDLSSVPELLRQGELTARQAELLLKIGSEYNRIRSETDDVLGEKMAGTRSFMWSDTFNNEDWKALHQVARECYQILSQGKDPIIND
jgi:hypothetical protein